MDRFGAATNCFTIAAGMFLSNNDLSHHYFVLDGDVYVSEELKREQIRKKLVGDDPLMTQLQDSTLNSIFQYNLPNDVSPEKFIYETLLNDSFNGNALEDDKQEIIDLLRQMPIPAENHGFINDLIAQLGESREAGLNRVIQLLSMTSKWNDYVQPIYDFLYPYSVSLLEPSTTLPASA